MARKVIGWGFAVIALYLAVNYYTGFSKDESSAASGTEGLVKAFQGR
jgi:hypothetical protein